MYEILALIFQIKTLLCNLCTMAYNRKNYIIRLQYIVSVYKAYKHDDIPDSHIVRFHFPKHQIFITYRQWMNIKNTPIPNVGQTKIEPIEDRKIA